MNEIEMWEKKCVHKILSTNWIFPFHSNSSSEYIDVFAKFSQGAETFSSIRQLFLFPPPRQLDCAVSEWWKNFNLFRQKFRNHHQSQKEKRKQLSMMMDKDFSVQKFTNRKTRMIEVMMQKKQSKSLIILGIANLFVSLLSWISRKHQFACYFR